MFLLLGFLSSTSTPVVPDNAVLERLDPVLRACSAVLTQETAETVEALETELASLLEETQHVADEALAVLVGFDVGTHPGEDIHCEVVARGERMLPYLEKYQRAGKASIPGLPENLRRSGAVEYQLLIERIADGATCEREP